MVWHVALYQFPVSSTEPIKNLNCIRELCQVRDLQDLDFLLLPELFISGFYYPESTQEQALRDMEEEAEALLLAKAKRDQVHICGSVREFIGGKYFNSLVCWTKDGLRLHLYQKMHLFFQLGEAEHFQPGSTPGSFILEDWNLIGAICYDLRFPELFRAGLSPRNDLILLPAQWPMKRLGHWRALIQARAIESQAPVIACNGCGGSLAGHSLIVNGKGDILAEAGEGTELISARLNPQDEMAWRQAFPVLQDRRDWQIFQPQRNPFS